MSQKVTSISSAPSFAIAADAVHSSDGYLLELLNQREALHPDLADGLEGWRDEAGDRARLQSLPTTRDEEWRFTNLSPLLDVSFTAAAQFDDLDISSLAIPEAAGSRLTFVNGRYAASLSDTSALPAGVTVGSLSSLSPERQAHVQQHLTLDAMGQADVFALLNSACLSDVAVIWVERNCVVETPIHLLFVSSAGNNPSLSYPRSLVVADRSSAVTLVEQFVGMGGGQYFANAVTEILLGENAQVEHCKWQQESDTSFHIARTAIAQAQDSRYIGHTISTGARLSRHTLSVRQDGLNTATTLNGLTVVAGSQLSDTHTAIDHAQPQGTSDQIHKCIVGDRAHSVFNGKIVVRQDAQMTDSSQSSRNLLLSSKARVDTKPQLEIFADNVKCAHGATVSQLEADEIFYLQSRGLSQEKARQLLTYAFAVESIDRISIDSVAEQLRQFVLVRTNLDS
jgi:Fe-S cluster assembly protein SufD